MDLFETSKEIWGEAIESLRLPNIRTTLDEHPDWVDVSTDIRNAFNSMHRRAFMTVIAQRFPGLWRWIYSCYGDPTEVYVRRDGGLLPEVVISRCDRTMVRTVQK